MTTIGMYLLHRLKEIGIDHLFGVAGDFVLGFFNSVLKSEVSFIGTCNELNAAYAADGYARIKGIGAFSTTYTVGELSAINGLAGSFAENIPVIAITGVPATENFKKETLLHHTLGDYKIPYEMFQKITIASTLLDQPQRAAEEIDRVLFACLETKKPVYIAIPADMVDHPIEAPKPFVFPQKKQSNPDQLQEALKEAIAMIEKASQPIFLADAEVIRFGLQTQFKALLEKTGFPYATLMLGKTVLDEEHPQFIGQYQGIRTRDALRHRVEDADVIILLGGLLSDLNTGGFSAKLPAEKMISANIHSLKIKHHIYDQVELEDFMKGLEKALTKRSQTSLNIHPASQSCVHRRSMEFTSKRGQKLTLARFYDRISHFIEPKSIVLAETGSSMFSASETLMPKGTTFIGQTFYGSIGYTVGATLGAACAAPERRAVLFIGDGSFQLTCQDISTMMRQHLNPVIFLINNDGYTIERVIIDNDYNNIASWKYHKLPEVLGNGIGYDVHTEDQLDHALEQALKSDKLTLVEIHLERFDCSDSLKEAGEAMAKTNKLV
jgi:TPP-dependent 2-oxoacid decarboxylase